MINLLFVYGTLLRSDNEFGSYLQQNCSFVAFGELQGKLYDFGEYPGVILSSELDEVVHGSVFRMKNPRSTLKRLDYYEGVGPDEEQPNLYRREIHQIKTGQGLIQAWVYVYNKSVQHATFVPEGDYMAYLNKKSPGK